MDLYIKTTLEELVKIFKLLGFEVIKEDKYFSAKLEQPNGRFHAMFAKLGDKVYCDFHFDYPKHKWFFGVDYKKKPKDFFDKKLRKIFENKKIQFKIKEVNWFIRRNKAISGGFKL
jgi:hypothetical protein